MDSIPKIVMSLQQTARQVGFEPPSDSAAKGVIGLGLPEAVAALYPRLEAVRVREFIQVYGTVFRMNDALVSPMFQGAASVLTQMHQSGIRLAIATGKSRVGLERVLAGSGCAEFFSHSRCADETHSKPHPAMVHELLTESGFEPEQALVVGDSIFDMEMAKRANVARVAVSFGAGHPDHLLKYEPRLCIDLLEDLLCLL